MGRSVGRLGALALVALVVGGCRVTEPPPSPDGSTGPEPSVVGSGASVVPVIVSSEQVVGENRFVFSFIDAKTNAPAAAPDRTASVAFTDLTRSPDTPTAPVQGRFVWGIQSVRGMYVANVTFPAAGEWAADFRTAAPGGPEETVRVRFEVHETGSSVRVGARAPASDTPTAGDVGGDLTRLSTDRHPLPAFYELSVADALAAGRPFVLVFATPAFCTSKQCGPTLDRVKPFVTEFPSVAFINVEPFELEFVDGRLQPSLSAEGQLQPVAAVREWGIPSEPWIFVVDRAGVVSASFEGVAGADELREAIAAVAG